MIELLSAPLLLKAVDFLFDEASKILKERRENRKEQEKKDKEKTISENLPSSMKERKAEDIVQSKDAALQQKIDENVWLSAETEIKHLLSLLEIHTRHYYLAKEQYAKWGGALVPPIIMTNLTEAEDEIATAIEKLRGVVSKIYGKQVILPEVE